MDTFLVGVKAFVLNEKEEILVLQRSASAPSNPNVWDLPGGLLDYDEMPKEAIEREILEETGLELINLKIHSNTVFKRLEQPTVVVLYVGEAFEADVQISDEHSDFKWVSFEEMKQIDLQPWIAEHIKRFDSIK